MFAAAFLISLVWVWFQFGIKTAILFSFIAVLPFFVLGGRRYVWLPLVLCWILYSLEAQFNHVLDRSYQHQVVPLTVCVDEVPKVFADGYIAFYGKVTSQPAALSLRTVKISINEDIAASLSPLLAGDCLAADIRLRQPLGRIIPGSFNADRFNFAMGIDAYGSVVDVVSVFSKPTITQQWYQKRAHQFSDADARDAWAALAFGWSYSMSSELKSLFAANQIMHLFVISGMHLAFVAMLLGVIVQSVGWLLSSYIVIGYRTKAVIVFIGLLFYVTLIGFPVPALRALIMATVPALVFLGAIKINWYRSFLWSIVLVTIFQPGCWLALGAWLSFTSVALILLIHHWRLLARCHWALAAVLFQLVMSASIVPWAILSGFEINIFSLLINLLLAPLVMVVGLPLVVLTILTPWAWPVQFIQNSVGLFRDALAWSAQYSFQLPFITPSLVLLAIATGCYFIWNRQWLTTLIWMFPFLMLCLLAVVDKSAFNAHHDRVTFFDVGHGQAVLFETAHSKLLYDTAGDFSKQESLMEASLYRQLPKLSAVIVSHSDTDHARGYGFLKQVQPRMATWIGQDGDYLGGESALNCHESVITIPQFQFLPIPEGLRTSDNDHSCVLRFQSGQYSVLLTGDASRQLEYYLMQQYAELLPANILLLGHHGSDGSSASDWLELHEQAKFIVSTGDRAAPKWPSPRILQWFSRHQITPLNTAAVGTIQITFLPQRNLVKTWDSAYRIRLIN